MRSCLLLLVGLLSCSGERSVSPGTSELSGKLFFILQEAREVRYVDPQGIRTAFPTGDIPNWLVFAKDTIYLVNSGGFSGVPSISMYSSDFVSLGEFPLDDRYNPLEAIYLNGKLYMTDFGKLFSRKLLVFKDSSVVDSVILSPRPISLEYFQGYIFVSTNGMDENYNYIYPSKLYKLDTLLNVLDSVSLREGASSNGIKFASGKLFFLSSGVPSTKPACIYAMDPQTLDILDSLVLPKNAYAFNTNGNLILAGDFFGMLYITDVSFSFLDSLLVGSTINFIETDGERFYISINGYSGIHSNYILIYDGEIVESLKVSEGDLGIGFLKYVR